MRLQITHVHHFDEGQAERLLDIIDFKFGKLTRKLEAIMAKLEDLQPILAKIAGQVDKIGTETQTLLDKVSQLEASNPDQQALIDSIVDQAQKVADRTQAIDDLVPDSVEPVPPSDTPSDTPSEPTV